VNANTAALRRTDRVPFAFRLIRSGFGVMSRVAPEWTATPASSLFMKPARKRLTRAEAAILATGRRLTVEVEGHRVAAWTWGSGPGVLLVHGWGGRGSQLAGFVEPLVGAGYRCTLYDAPAHGDSSGDRSNLPEVSRVIRAMAGTIGDTVAVIAHSMGAAATAVALCDGLSLGAAAFLAPPEDMEYFARVFAQRLGLTDRTRAALRRRVERHIRRGWDEFRASAVAPGRTTPLVVVHDREDLDVPWSHGHRWVAEWPEARLVTTSGLGHKGLLRDAGVIDETIAFVGSATRRTAGRLPASR